MRITYILRKPAGEGKYYTTCLLEHLRYSGDAVLGWREKDNCFDVLMLSFTESLPSHKRQIERAKSFGFQYMKTNRYMNQIPEDFEFRSYTEKAKENE